jgi:hypothetical protein
MAHYAYIENSQVIKVFPGREENDTADLPDGVSSWEEYYGNKRGYTCKRTSYNTYGNEHKLGGTPFRGNYASIGFIYDEVNDVFYEQDPSDENTTYQLNTNNWLWEEVSP